MVVHGFPQGLTWYTSKLKEDCDGDVAEEFLEEPPGEPSTSQLASSQRGAIPPLQVVLRAHFSCRVFPSTGLHVSAVKAWCGDCLVACVQVQSQNLTHASPGPVFVHEGNVHMVPPR
jgi:hypothetical protein